MTASSGTLGRKAVIIAILGAVAVMFVTSFVYRMNHPNLYVSATQKQGPSEPVDHDHDGDGIQDDGPNAGKRTSEINSPPPGMSAMGGMGQVKEFMARVEANPEDVEALMNLGNAFLMMRAWDRALEPLEKANELKPGNTELLKAIGIAHFNKEDYVKATGAYDEILEIDPADTLALFNLGVIHKHYFDKPDAARRYFEKVLELEKDDAEMRKLAQQELKK